MPFTALEKTQIISQVFAIPIGANGMIVTSITHLPPSMAMAWTVTYTEGQYTELVTQITTYLTNASDSTILLVRELLPKFKATIGNPMVVNKSGTAEGVLIDYPKQHEMLRQEIAKLLGIWVPQGGFIRETEKLWNMYGSGLGDR